MDSNSWIVSAYKHKKKRGHPKKPKSNNVQIDTRPEWMQNLRIVKGGYFPKRDKWSTKIQHTRSNFHARGYKILSQDMKAYKGFQYQIGKKYTHIGKLQLCKSGFHFSADALQCLRYAEFLKLEKPYRLFEVEGSGESYLGADKNCSRHIELKREVIGKEKKSLLTGISILPTTLRCYKAGRLHDPAPNFWAVQSKFQIEPSYSFIKGKKMDYSYPEHVSWPPPPLDLE